MTRAAFRKKRGSSTGKKTQLMSPRQRNQSQIAECFASPSWPVKEGDQGLPTLQRKGHSVEERSLIRMHNFTHGASFLQFCRRMASRSPIAARAAGGLLYLKELSSHSG